MNSRDIMQKHPIDVEETKKKLKTMELADETKAVVAVTDPWEEAAKEQYALENAHKDDSTWGTWSDQEILLIKKGYEDAIAKYGAEIFDGDDEERIDIVVFDSPDVATATDDELDAVVEDPVNAATTAKEVPAVDVVTDAITTKEPAQVDDPEEDPLQEEEDPEEEPEVPGVPEDDANVPDDAACPNADMDASAVSSSNPLPDRP